MARLPFVESDLFERLEAVAVRLRRPLPEMIRHYLLEEVVRYIVRVPPPDSFVLCGGMLARLWAAPVPRPVQDLELFATFSYDVEDTLQRFQPSISTVEESSFRFQPTSVRVEKAPQATKCRKVHLSCELGLHRYEFSLTLVIGFDDFLVPPPEFIDYPCILGPPTRILANRPETEIAWKLVGLTGGGESNWRPEDLHDLLLLTESVPTSEDDLEKAIDVAFTSRGIPEGELSELLEGRGWWRGEGAQSRWEDFCRDASDRTVPESIGLVLTLIERRIQSALGRT